MIRTSLTAVPRRLPVLWAKTAVYAAVIWVPMTAAAVTAFLLSQAILSSPGIGDRRWAIPGSHGRCWAAPRTSRCWRC